MDFTLMVAGASVMVISELLFYETLTPVVWPDFDKKGRILRAFCIATCFLGAVLYIEGVFVP